MSDRASLLQADDEARAKALDISQSLIVQAPAGSGKTELLIQRYLRLLGTVNEPEEVIAITFTRKAAAEMRTRVLVALRDAAAGKVTEESHRQLTAKLANTVLQRSTERDWQLLQNARRMRIQTLDALNASIARARPLTAGGMAAGARMLAGADLKLCYQSAALATLDWLQESGTPSTATTEVLSHVDNNTWVYISYLAEMLATRDQWLPIVGRGNLADDDARYLREEFESNLRTAIRTHLAATTAAFAPYEQICELFDQAAQNVIETAGPDHPVAALLGCDDLPEASERTVAQWQGIAELVLTRAATPTVRKTVTKAQGFPPTNKDRKAAMVSMLEALAENEELAELLHGVRSLPPHEYQDEQWSVLRALFLLLPLAVSELKRLFAEQGVSDHIEVALAAAAALGSVEDPGEMALLLDYKLQHVLVDEMQDTSLAQYQMLEMLTAGWTPGDGRTLFCVGDPMQSIYRFRNAEVGQFLLAQQHGIGAIKMQRLLLRRNFRSGQVLVDWFNEAFPQTMAAVDDPGRGAVSYESAISTPQHAALGAVHTYPIVGDDRKAEGECGRNVIRDLMEQHPQDSIAVLVRGRAQLPELLAELRNSGIAYSAIEIDTLTDLPEVIDVLALTRAAAHPADRLAWLAVLRSPWCGLTWTDLHTLVHSDRNRTVLELLQDDKRRQKISPAGQTALGHISPILQKLVAGSATRSLRDRVEAAWLALGGPAIVRGALAIENVYRYLDILADHEVAGSLHDVAALEAVLDEEKVSSGGASRLQILTMHKAKGLQFDHVVLYGLGRQPGSGNTKLLSWLDTPQEEGNSLKIVAPIGARVDDSGDPTHQFIEFSERRKQWHEQARLLYVACTRARRSLHLIGNANPDNDGERCRPPRRDSLLFRLWHVLRDEFDGAVEAAGGEGPGDDPSEWLLPKRRTFVDTWSPPTPTPPPSAETESHEQEAPAVEFYWVGSEARVAGTVIHRWLQKIASSPDDPSTNGDRRKQTLRWLREMGFAGEVADNIEQRVDLTLQRALDDEQAQWILSGNGHSELPLSGLHNGERVSVVIDRVRIDDDGQHWIIDYKTGTHEGGNVEGFIRAERERYAAQLQRYASLYAAWTGTTPRQALYFPMLQRFEVLT